MLVFQTHKRKYRQPEIARLIAFGARAWPPGFAAMALKKAMNSVMMEIKIGVTRV